MIRALVLAAFFAAGCADAPSAPTVFAAASTTDVARAVAGGAPVSVAASSVLARQVARGAPAAVFLSADPDWVDWLEEQGVDVLDRRTVAEGRLVVVGPPGTAPVDDVWGALASAERIALADPSHVPAGRYAAEALRAADVWDRVADRFVLMGDVRAALAAVETRAAGRALVYATDARASRRVVVVAEVPASLHRPIRVEAALLRPEGRALYDALGDPSAWTAAGFSVP